MPTRKSIYSLFALQERLLAANHRHLKFIAAIDTPETGIKRLHPPCAPLRRQGTTENRGLPQVTETKIENQRRHKGFNLLAEHDACLLQLLLRGEFCVVGLTNRTLRQLLTGTNSGQISRLLKPRGCTG